MTIIGTLLGAAALFFAGLVAFLFKYKAFEGQEIEPLDTPLEDPKLPPTHSLPIEPKPLPMPEKTKTEELYELSKSLLGSHLGKDTSVPWMVNCANALTDVLIRSGVRGLPKLGIAGTAQLLRFLVDSDQFKEVSAYTPGAVIISATGTGNGKIRGHGGICGNFVIMSNNSETGRWDDQWSWERWYNYYTQYGGIPSRFFIPV